MLKPLDSRRPLFSARVPLLRVVQQSVFKLWFIFTLHRLAPPHIWFCVFRFFCIHICIHDTEAEIQLVWPLRSLKACPPPRSTYLQTCTHIQSSINPAYRNAIFWYEVVVVVRFRRLFKAASEISQGRRVLNITLVGKLGWKFVPRNVCLICPLTRPKRFN